MRQSKVLMGSYTLPHPSPCTQRNRKVNFNYHVLCKPRNSFALDLINPAVQGTVGMLESARKERYVKLSLDGRDRLTKIIIPSHQVKRIVITSSCASILSILPEAREFSENDWADSAIKEVEEFGPNDDITSESRGYTIYRASKTLAERGIFLCLIPPCFCEPNAVPFYKVHGTTIISTKKRSNGISQLSIRLS